MEVGWTCSTAACETSQCVSTCGDGVRVDGEECDDGNVHELDGCSAQCTVECGFTCASGEDGNTKDTCTATCGDGVRSYFVEDCDDGNVVDGDGCSSTCQIEEGWTCAGDWCDTVSCTPICGDGKRVGVEECDDGNGWSFDGCSGCTVECGWDCSMGDCEGVCGDGMRKGSEECDDGNEVSGDGCSRYCQIEADYVCEGALDYTECGGTGDVCEPDCGLGTRPQGSTKECDDGNLASGDGCSSACRIECGWSCAGGSDGSADACISECGDQEVGGDEECDDGNLADGDGCSKYCRVEPGYSCVHLSVPPYPCGAYADSCMPVCGDGVTVGSEVGKEGYCDDGNYVSGDGCSGSCEVECGYTCSGGDERSKDLCETTCGDGLRAGEEECDDGNDAAGDGCFRCLVEPGWSCSDSVCASSICTAVCALGNPGFGLCQPCRFNAFTEHCETCNMLTMCSGHGRCMGRGGCECFPDWVGQDCSYPKCLDSSLLVVDMLSLKQIETNVVVEWEHSFLQSPAYAIEMQVMGSNHLFPSSTFTCNQDVGRCTSTLNISIREFFAHDLPSDCPLDASLTVGTIKCHGRECMVKTSLAAAEYSEQQNSLSWCPEGFAPSNGSCVPCDIDLYRVECAKQCTVIDTCSGHGRCRGRSGHCNCYPGWQGPSCNETVAADMMSWCQKPFREENGSCVPCEVDMYTGECAKACTVIHTCHGHGRCQGRTGSCKCYPGWHGPDCNARCRSITLPVSVGLQNLCSEKGLSSDTSIQIIGPPSAPLILDQILQTSEKWSVHWTRPSIFWTEAHAQPVGYLVQIWCGGESMELIYNDSASVQSPVFVSNFSADWGYAGSLRALTLVPEDVEAVVVTQPALICQQGQKINVSVTARNRAFKSPTAVITQKLAAPPSEVGGLRFVEYTGGVTLFWEQVRVSLIIMYCMQVLLC